MQATHLPFSAQIRRYRHLARKVNRLLKSGTFQFLPQREQRKILTKLRDRLKRIGQLIPNAQLKGALAGVAILLGTASGVNGQSFSPPVISPFGIAPGSTYGYQSFADIDGDGDLDLLVNGYDSNSYQYGLLYYENTGTAENPVFSPNDFEFNPFGISGVYLTQPILADFDNDGDLDIISGNIYGGGFSFQENIGTATSPNFSTPQINPFGLSASPMLDFATAADLDGDGDIDILGGGFYGNLNFFENIGTPEAPAFTAPVINPFGIAPSGIIVVPHFCDLDKDGDFDLLMMNFDGYNGVISYAKNIGSPSNPIFSPQFDNPFGIIANGITIPIPCATDIDNDGDFDVFINDYYGTSIHFYENLNINVDYPPTSTDNTITTPEDGLYYFDVSDFSFADANSGDQLQMVQITTLPAKGSLKLGSTPVTVDQIIPVSEIINLVFTPALNEFGTNYTTYKFKVSDGGLWSTSDYTLTFNVTSVNDAPTTQNSEVTGSNDFPFIFKLADFPYSDIENDAQGNVKITSLPAKGSLKFGGNNVSAGQIIPATEVQNLSFNAVPGESGTAYTSFGFQLSDGILFSNTATMTINILETSATTSRTLNALVKLSPNPTSESLNIHLESTTLLEQPSLIIYDALGQVVATEQIKNGSRVFDFQMNVSHLSSGFYFVKIEDKGKTSMTKFVKE